MGWKNAGAAITIADRNHNDVELDITSCTTQLADDGGGDWHLRMFGGIEGSVSSAGGTQRQVNPASPGDVEQGNGPNLGYLDSDANSTTFYLAFGASIPATVIPMTKQPKDLYLDGAITTCTVTYGDPGIVHLPDGKGWLMLLARYAFEGASADTKVNRSARTAIVGYWAVEDDPTFSGTGVRGPFWLSSRVHERDGDTAVLWQSVPGGVVSEWEGEQYLFLYYNAEYSEDPTQARTAVDLGFFTGARVRRIKLDDLLGAKDSLQWRGWIEEEKWDEDNEYWLITGEELGHVRVWVPTGDRFAVGDDPGLDHKGNKRIEEAFYDGTNRQMVYAVDPAPFVDPGTGRLGLVFAGKLPEVEEGTLNAASATANSPQPYGVWRAVALPAGRTPSFGRDFVIAASATDPTLSRDLAIASPTAVGNLKDEYYDPDPVQLPNLTWSVFVGHQQDTGGTSSSAPLTRLEVDEETMATGALVAWNPWGSPSTRIHTTYP